MKNIILAGLALPMLIGCSSMEEKTETVGNAGTSPKVVHPVEQDATMEYRNKERGVWGVI